MLTPIFPELSVKMELPMTFAPVNLASLPEAPSPVMVSTASGPGDAPTRELSFRAAPLTTSCSILFRRLPFVSVTVMVARYTPSGTLTPRWLTIGQRMEWPSESCVSKISSPEGA
jgi:hypothetical protein